MSLPLLAEKVLAFRMREIANGRSPGERFVMDAAAEDVLGYRSALGGPYLTFDNPFQRPELLGVELRISPPTGAQVGPDSDRAGEPAAAESLSPQNH